MFLAWLVIPLYAFGDKDNTASSKLLLDIFPAFC